MTTHPLPIVPCPGGYSIDASETEGVETMEPYPSHREAERDRAGVERFLRRQDAGLNPFE